MTIADIVVNTTIRGLTRLLCRVYDDQLDRVPDGGPLILVSNHINFIEVPLLYTHLQPRPVTGFAKAETWDNPALRVLFNLWGGIPLRRGEADLLALRRGLEQLGRGYILAIAPEGTRSRNGQLQRGYPGIALLAIHSRAPVLPVAYYGGELLRHNLTRLRRTDFRILVGRPFIVDPGEGRITRKMRQDITDEIMYQLAALLPPAYRGMYFDLEQASQVYLRYIQPMSKTLPVKLESKAG
jgi:1-acyl-sn-glycerol-3-phosphate acyltransferase